MIVNGQSRKKPDFADTRLTQYPLVMCYIAIEHGPVEIVSFPMKNGDFPYLCKCLPEGKPPFSYGFPMVFPLKPPFSHGFPMVFL